jgi:hypothetical protein
MDSKLGLGQEEAHRSRGLHSTRLLRHDQPKLPGPASLSSRESDQIEQQGDVCSEHFGFGCCSHRRTLAIKFD